GEDQPAAGGDPCGGGTERIGYEAGRDETDYRHVQHDEEPEIPRHQKASLIAESQARPLVQSAFERQEAIEMRDHHGQRDEEEDEGDQPEDDVRRSGLGGGAE